MTTFILKYFFKVCFFFSREILQMKTFYFLLMKDGWSGVLNLTIGKIDNIWE